MLRRYLESGEVVDVQLDYGVRVVGVVKDYDQYTILVEGEEQVLIYKTAIIMMGAVSTCAPVVYSPAPPRTASPAPERSMKRPRRNGFLGLVTKDRRPRV